MRPYYGSLKFASSHVMRTVLALMMRSEGFEAIRAIGGDVNAAFQSGNEVQIDLAFLPNDNLGKAISSMLTPAVLAQLTLNAQEQSNQFVVHEHQNIDEGDSLLVEAFHNMAEGNFVDLYYVKLLWAYNSAIVFVLGLRMAPATPLPYRTLSVIASQIATPEQFAEAVVDMVNKIAECKPASA